MESCSTETYGSGILICAILHGTHRYVGEGDCPPVTQAYGLRASHSGTTQTTMASFYPSQHAEARKYASSRKFDRQRRIVVARRRTSMIRCAQSRGHPENDTRGSLLVFLHKLFGVLVLRRRHESMVCVFQAKRDNGHHDIIMLQETHVAQTKSHINAGEVAHLWGYRTGNGVPPLSYWSRLEFSSAGVANFCSLKISFTDPEPYLKQW